MTFPGRAASRSFGKNRMAMVIALIAVATGTALGYASRQALWEGWLIDRLFQVRSHFADWGSLPPAPVAVVGLDQVALDSDRLSPVPRVFMTPVFAETGTAMLDAGAVALGYDFVFAFSADEFADPTTGEARLRGFDRPFLAFLYKNRGRVFVARTSTGVPHRAISAAAGTSGVRSAEITPDADGVVRRHSPRPPLEQSPSIIDALLASVRSPVSQNYIAVPSHRMATSIPYLSLLDVMTLVESETGRERLKEFASGRIVLFGSTIPHEDEHLYSDRFLPGLPLDMAETGEAGRPAVRHATAGVYVLADLIGSALSGRTAVEVPMSALMVLAFAFALLGAGAGLALPLPILPVFAVMGAAAGLGLSYTALGLGYLPSPGVAPVACIAGMVVAAVGKVGLLQRRERSLVRLFGHYLSPDVIQEMADSEQLPELGGDTRYVVVAFIDIVGFTQMSAKLPDHDVVRVVNTCFDSIGQVIIKQHGYIDKYIGDAIMAVWNAPNLVDKPEQAAIDAAREIIGLLDSIRTETGQPALDLRIALHAGPVLVGDIGGQYRRSFTVMGTTVNTASRIEAVAKDAGVRLAASESVVAKISDNYPLRQIWSGRLRGLSQDTVVFTLEEPQMFMGKDSAAQDKPVKPIQPKLLKFPR